MATFDIVIRGATIADGTGAPLRVGDVGIQNGVIAAVGHGLDEGLREIDAHGLLVTPGFVDIHTHYDGQAIWDSRLAPTSWHGVTTVVMGNCGVGFAPVRARDRDQLVSLMEGVEDIPEACLTEGLDWSWETFEEFLLALERRPHDVDVCTLLPHAALRVYVMGERALRHEPATDEDNLKMRELTARAMRAGALGFSTSRASSHKTLKGDAIPSLKAEESELTSIAMGMKDAGHGFIEFISDWTEESPEIEFDVFKRVVAASGRPGLVSVTQRHHQPDVWRKIMKLCAKAISEGLPIRPVVAPRAIGVLFSLQGTQNPFSGTRTYGSIATLPLADRVAAMRDPDFKRRVLADDPFELSTFAFLSRLSSDRVFRFGNPPNYSPSKDDSAVAMAAREGRTANDVLYDLLLEDDGRALLFTPIVNYFEYDQEVCREMLEDPNALVGLGDGGAHVGFITDSSFPTYLLAYWGRDRQEFELAELVRRQTSENARAVGLMDRGTIEPGMKADLNIIDMKRLEIDAPYLQSDLPAGGRRLLQRAKGYIMTMVAGIPTYCDGEAQPALPGKIVRGPQTAPI